LLDDEFWLTHVADEPLSIPVLFQRGKDGLAQNSISLGSVIKIKMYLIHKVKLRNKLKMGHPLNTDLLLD
jgi:hypothetical protein